MKEENTRREIRNEHISNYLPRSQRGFGKGNISELRAVPIGLRKLGGFYEFWGFWVRMWPSKIQVLLGFFGHIDRLPYEDIIIILTKTKEVVNVKNFRRQQRNSSI